MTSLQRSRIGAACSVLALLALGTLVPAQAHHVEDDEDRQDVAATDQMVRELEEYEVDRSSARQARLERAAERRKARLLRLIERNPRLATIRLLPPGLRERMPAAAQAHVEEEVAIEGEVFASVADDFERGVSKREFLLRRNGSDTPFVLRVAGADERQLNRWAGKRVRVRAARLDTSLLVRNAGEVNVVAAGGGTAQAAVAAAPVVSGDQRTLVILANFNNKSLTCSPADVSNRIFGTTGSTVNNNFIASSRNAVTFSGRVIGPVNIPYAASGTCNYIGWADAADAAARALGVNPSDYMRVNYVTPGHSGCGWSGLAYMPGRRSWVQSCTATGVFSHEFGHNLSLHHAATPTSEYGDGSDPMGGARVVLNNAANQSMAGWLPAGGLQDVVSGGSYAVSALGPTATASPQVLRLDKPDTDEKYYVSLRQRTGLDTALSTTFHNVLSVHRASGTLPTKTYLLQTLGVGQSFSDATNGITITHQGLAGNTSTVGISVGGAECTRSAPTVTVTPASASAISGTAILYTVTLTNRNSSACGASTFALSQTLPPSFGGSFTPAGLSLASGASASATWRVVPALWVQPATYTLDVSAAETSGPATVAHASYLVLVREKTPPSLSITSPSVFSGTTATLTATASDDSGIKNVAFYAEGKLLATDASAPYSATWKLAGMQGQRTIQAIATDKQGNKATQTMVVTVQ